MTEVVLAQYKLVTNAAPVFQKDQKKKWFPSQALAPKPAQKMFGGKLPNMDVKSKYWCKQGGSIFLSFSSKLGQHLVKKGYKSPNLT